jgi:hypothetical protein
MVLSPMHPSLTNHRKTSATTLQGSKKSLSPRSLVNLVAEQLDRLTLLSNRKH